MPKRRRPDEPAAAPDLAAVERRIARSFGSLNKAAVTLPKRLLAKAMAIARLRRPRDRPPTDEN